MKKLLTVLLVIAVICTFSFGSAFAAQTQTYNAQVSTDKLYSAEAYYYATTTVSGATVETGAYGITEAYKNALVDDWTYVLNDALTAKNASGLTKATLTNNVEYANYCPAEQEAAKAAITTAVDTFKNATTAKAAYKAEAALIAKLAKLARVTLVEGSMTDLYGTLNLGMGTALGAAATTYLLPGYGFFAGLNKDVATLTDSSVKLNNVNTDAAKAMWFYDNGYRTFASAKAHVADFQKALVPVVEGGTELKALQAEFNAINAKAKAAAAAYSKAADYVAASVEDVTIDALEAIYAEEYAYDSKVKDTTYAKRAAVYGNSGFATFAETKGVLEYAYEHQYDAEVKAVDLTDKDAVVALVNKISNMGKEFTFLTDSDYGNVTFTAPSTTAYAALTKAYSDFKEADEAAYDAVKGKFSVMELGDGYYFDNSEENVAAVKAARIAYDELSKYYFYANIEEEAAILAAEHNMTASAQYDEKNDKLDNTKLQAYLNNATLTVKSTKLAAKKVKVQAKFSAADYKGVVEEFGTGYTMSYKFYFKAPGKSYKLTKTKDVNYITYTSKSLKAGKNYFKVGVVVKDADGKVVAEKLYNASGAAYRTIK